MILLLLLLLLNALYFIFCMWCIVFAVSAFCHFHIATAAGISKFLRPSKKCNIVNRASRLIYINRAWTLRAHWCMDACRLHSRTAQYPLLPVWEGAKRECSRACRPITTARKKITHGSPAYAINYMTETAWGDHCHWFHYVGVRCPAVCVCACDRGNLIKSAVFCLYNVYESNERFPKHSFRHAWKS